MKNPEQGLAEDPIEAAFEAGKYAEAMKGTGVNRNNQRDDAEMMIKNRAKGKNSKRKPDPKSKIHFTRDVI